MLPTNPPGDWTGVNSDMETTHMAAKKKTAKKATKKTAKKAKKK